MAIVETRISVWEALAGRAPGQPLGPADPGLWTAVAERVNPAKARPKLRPGIEDSNLVSVRGVPYTMLRSPDVKLACYLRLTPDEVELSHLMDGTRTLARLVADFARISGRLAPDRVRRIVADLAGNRMLEELPLDAFAPLQRVRHAPWPIHLGRGLLAFIQGRRMVLANIDPLVGFLYRAGGRVLFTRAAAALMITIAGVGLVAFGWQWWTGEQSVFLTQDSYVSGAAVLLGLNIMALACHELGHALATKHAGRRVPAAGFLVYFGIPSLFVDTTDVWMAGRRGRLLTTAAGPAAGLVLAGASALVGFAVPEAAPWCFKLSFAWYINALFNLNPFLALDGYYLVMDWLEVPNLRARGLAWVATRLRRRPPSWKALDREGRLVALYGFLAIGWLVVALNIAYRVYVDRVGGLITGLWRSGWTARVLLVAVVAALMSPIVYILFGWLARRWRRFWQRLRESHLARDVPRRLDALRSSSLRSLPGDTLAGLATKSRWVYPRTGEQLVFAGAAQPNVLAVVEGALEARAPGDPAGTVRERVGAGGVVGIGAAVAGSPSPLAWYAAGTRLLAVPSTAVAAAVGPLGGGVGGSFGTAAEAEALLAESPALSGLSYEDKMGLASVAVPVSVAPGASVLLNGPDDVIVLAAGVIATPDGQELGRGTLIGPAGEERPGAVASARTPVRLFSLPAVNGLPLLLGTPVRALVAEAQGRAPGAPPVTGVHPMQAYPPLAGPPEPPRRVDDSTDRRFERRLWWFLLLVLLLGLFMTGANVVIEPKAWNEMPSDHALVQVERGTVTVVVAGREHVLRENDEIYVGEFDDISVALRSHALMTFRGGATSFLCAATRLTMGQLLSVGHPVQPSAELNLHTGKAIMTTASTSPRFHDLDSAVITDHGVAANQGEALFAVTSWGVQVAQGRVTEGGALLDVDGGQLDCGDGTGVYLPPSPPEPTPTETPSPTPSLTPTPSPTSSASPTAPATTTTTKPQTTTKTTTQPPPTPPPPPPPDTTRPAIAVVRVTPPELLGQNPPPGFVCLRSQATQALTVFAEVTDTPNAATTLTVSFRWKLDVDGSSGSVAMPLVGDPLFNGSMTMPYTKDRANGGKIEITVIARDKAGNVSQAAPVTVALEPCTLIQILA